MKKLAVVLFAMLFAVALGGCVEAVEGVPGAAISTETPTEAPSPSRADMEEIFLQTLNDEGILAKNGISEADALTLGYEICEYLNAGRTDNEVYYMLIGRGMWSDEAAFFVSAVRKTLWLVEK